MKYWIVRIVFLLPPQFICAQKNVLRRFSGEFFPASRSGTARDSVTLERPVAAGV
ncbi:MAG: hypothetical protein PWQ29_156 [Verrucomicrobiota bacterium]|jgi:hypothetical protein|nr:hypothetical protein [Verrucomicrobiota bacterium]